VIRQLAYLVQSVLSFIVFAGLRELRLDLWAVIVLIVVLNFLVILIHELGHAWAVVRWGATLRTICVMGIHYDVPKRRLSFRRLPHKAEVGGYVSYAPHPVQHSSKSALAIALAGPGANLLLALVAGAALLFLPDPTACIVSRGRKNACGSARCSTVLPRFWRSCRRESVCRTFCLSMAVTAK